MGLERVPSRPQCENWNAAQTCYAQSPKKKAARRGGPQSSFLVAIPAPVMMVPVMVVSRIVGVVAMMMAIIVIMIAVMAMMIVMMMVAVPGCSWDRAADGDCTDNA